MKNSEKEFNNTVYLMEVISTAYRKKHKMSIPKFLELNEKVDLLGYISGGAFLFDGLSEEEMLELAEEYVDEQRKINKSTNGREISKPMDRDKESHI